MKKDRKPVTLTMAKSFKETLGCDSDNSKEIELAL